MRGLASGLKPARMREQSYRECFRAERGSRACRSAESEHRMSINICKIHQKHTHRVLFRFKICLEVKRKEF